MVEGLVDDVILLPLRLTRETYKLKILAIEILKFDKNTYLFGEVVSFSRLISSF